MILQAPEQRWECPSCDLQQVTRRADVHTEFHHCRGLAGLWSPMVPAGTRAKVETREREDYIGKEHVQLHEGRPVMSVVVTRDDGQDCTIFAPSAVAHGSL
ncbi:MAG: hypothetical protein JOY78_03940 [Pseudonocardia sp.]|nr:hypothetical protein [Pseudonocardia sp.]